MYTTIRWLNGKVERGIFDAQADAEAYANKLLVAHPKEVLIYNTDGALLETVTRDGITPA